MRCGFLSLASPRLGNTAYTDHAATNRHRKTAKIYKKFRGVVLLALRGAYVLRSSPHVVEERRPLGVFRSSPHAVGKKVQHVLTNFHSQQRRSESGGAPQRHKKQGLGVAHLGLSSITCFFCLPGPATNKRPNGHRTSNKDKSAAHDTLGSGHSQR